MYKATSSARKFMIVKYAKAKEKKVVWPHRIMKPAVKRRKKVRNAKRK